MEQAADFTFIGSGIACTVSLTALFERLICEAPVKVYDITVIEPFPELWKGIPYGSRSSVNALTINTINDFFTNEEQGRQFFDWFAAGQDTILTNYLTTGGSAAQNWLNNNTAALIKQSWSAHDHADLRSRSP